MAIPEFTREHIGRDVGNSLSDAFARFTAEVLRPRYPDLHLFPERGKDGAIDFIVDFDSRRLVGECKVVGSKATGEPLKRWRAVFSRLQRNLALPEGPPRGQSQYVPWYRSDLPISEYLYCVTAELHAASGLDELRAQIEADIRGLAGRHQHLEHLQGIAVRVHDWADLFAAARPITLFRWFPGTRPRGMVPLDSGPVPKTFRAYLQSDRLPYYSLADHMATTAVPPGVAIADESALVDILDDSDTVGVLVSGMGGLGKTRLTLEIGRTADAHGWSVLRVEPGLRDDAVDELVTTLTSEDRTLLLLDYVETEPSFASFVERIASANASLGLVVRYAANCRTSYLPSLMSLNGQHVEDLSPVETAPSAAWRAEYRRSAVAHILDRAGLSADPRNLQVAGDRPILAVFLTYLSETGRTTELEQLLGLGDFGRWVSRRIELSFAVPNVSRELALLCSLLPLPLKTAMDRGEGLTRLIDRLAADGWIERGVRSDGEDEWRAIHDVIADQIVAAHLQGIPRTIEGFASELFDLAGDASVLDSALLAMQRLAELPIIEAVDWLEVFDRTLARQPEAWKALVSLLLRTPLLNLHEIIELLGRHDAVWSGMEAVPDVEFALAALVDRALTDDDLPPPKRRILEQWIERAAAAESASNFAITRALRFCPSLAVHSALSWLEEHVEEPQADYVLSAWLRANLPARDVRGHIRRWLELHGRSKWASFVLSAWLGAIESEVASAADAVSAWLAHHGTDRHAVFVYASWLSAGGDPELVRADVDRWLADNALELDAHILYRSWLDAHGAIALVEPHLAEWLREHAREARARSVFKSWLDVGGDSGFVRQPIREWLPLHGTDVQAGFVYQPWLDATRDTELVREPIRGWLTHHAADHRAQFIYKSWLEAEGDPELVREPIRQWLTLHGAHPEARFVYQPWLVVTGDTELVHEPMSEWLSHHATDQEARYVYKPWLEAKGDPELVREPIRQWLTLHRTHPEARFVYSPWLAVTLDTELVHEPVSEWLTHHATDLEARYVYKPWLEAKGDPELVREPIRQWLTEHGTVEEAGFVYQPWLDATRDTEPVREAIRNWLTHHVTTRHAGFVFRPWLGAKGDPELVREPIRDWLTEHGSVEEAGFVYQPWLDATRDTELVREPIRAWLIQHAADHRAQFVYTSWLKANGDPELVREAIRQWLTRHGADRRAQFVYRSWLKAHGDPELVRESIRDWFAQHGSVEEAGFVYQPWLDATRDTELVREPIRGWLTDHAADHRAQFVYRSWLKAHGDPELVREPIRQWLTLHGTDLKAQFVYKAWLNASHDVHHVQTPVRDWLDRHRTDQQAQFVYSSWLDAKGDPELVQEPIRDWLTQHAVIQDAAYVYRAWLGAGAEVGVVEAYAARWLGANPDHPSASAIRNALQ